MADNTVTVLVYGQEYTLNSDLSREQVLKMADHVDRLMKSIGAVPGQAKSATAVLAAMLASGEFFSAEAQASELAEINAQLEARAANYESLWEDAKQSFSIYKQDAENMGAQMDSIQAEADESRRQLEQVVSELARARAENEAMKEKLAELANQARNSKTAPEEAQEHIRELEDRCRDIESSFFDIQMENIRLKNEIEILKNNR